MAKSDVETSRIRDGVRDSKILRDTPSQLSQKSASLGAEADRVVTGLRHYPTHDCNQVRRDVPRVSAVDVGDGFQYRNRNVEEENKRYFRSNLHTYSGTPIIEDFWEWIDAIENYFEETKLPDKLQCKLASYTLIEEAEGWWYQLQHRRLFEGKLKIDSWNRMKHLLAKRFLPQNCSTKFSLQPISYSPMFLPPEYVQDGLKYEGNVANISNSKRSFSVVDIKKGKGNEVLKHLMAGSIMPNKCSTKLPNDWQGKIGQCLEELEVVICGPDEGDYLVTEEIEEYDDIEDNDTMYEGLAFLFTSEIENGEQLKQKAIENPMPTTCLIECSKEIKEGIASDFVSMKCPSKLEIIEQEGMVVAHNLVAVNALLKNVVGANDAEKLKGIVAVQKIIDKTNLGWTLKIKVGSFASVVNTTGDMVVFLFDPGGLMVDGLVEKFSSKVFIVGNETGGVAKEVNAMEERSRRRLWYESDFMNSDTHCMSFDPGGIFYPLDHNVCLVSLDPRFCVSFLIDLRVLPHVITLQISKASNEHSYTILACEKGGNSHIECIYVDSLWQKRSPKIIHAIGHGPFTTPGVCVLLDLRCTICMGALGYGELRTMYNTIVLGVVKVPVKLSLLYCSSWKHVKVHFAEFEHLLFRWGIILEINVDAEKIILLMLPLLYCLKKKWTAKHHYLSMAIVKPHHTYFVLITSPAMAVESRNSMLSKGAAPDLSVSDHLVFSWTKESVAYENFSLNDKWKEKLRPSSSAGVATSLRHWCFLRGKEKESMEGCVETIDEHTTSNMELNFLGSRIEALESYLRQTEEANGDSILQKIRQKDVRFLGAYTSPSNLYIGSEFMPNVYDFLHKQKVSFKLIALFKVVVEIASHAFPSRYIEYLFFIDSKWYRYWLDGEMNYLGYMINMAALHTLAPAWEFNANKQIGSKEIWTSGESYICVINGLPDYNFQVAHGRVILREEWNGENNAYMERELIMVEISVIIDSTYVNILSKNEKSRKSLKLFHMVVNGLDPPKNIDGECESSILDAYEFDRLGPMNLLATYHISWNFNVADLSLSLSRP